MNVERIETTRRWGALRRGLLTWLALALLLACDRRAATVTAPRDAPGAGGGPGVGILPDAVLVAVCRHEPCGGDSAIVRVYRRPDHTVGRLYRLHGSCVHSPGIYFEPDGALADAIPERPVVPGSPEAEELRRRHDRWIGGLTATDALRCRDGARVPP